MLAVTVRFRRERRCHRCRIRASTARSSVGQVTDSAADPGGRRRAMVDRLSASGALAPSWREAFLTVPRHRFIPDLIWDEDGTGEHYLMPVCRTDDPLGWLDRAYRDASVVTQVDDGHPVGPGLAGRLITSSASMPSVVAIMLAELGLRAGMRVLEVGAGTGYNAALLACRAGAALVTTVEIDPSVAAHASQALQGAGFGAVRVVVGDGSAGYPAGAPYDQVLCASWARPPSWTCVTSGSGGCPSTTFTTRIRRSSAARRCTRTSSSAITTRPPPSASGSRGCATSTPTPRSTQTTRCSG